MEDTHHYPFGLSMAGISSKALKSGYAENKKKYNGIEFDTTFGLDIYEADLRYLDPQTGRWWQIDPLTENTEMWSPYASNYNNPIRYSDPRGDRGEGCCEWLTDLKDWAVDKIENFKENTRNEINWVKNRVSEAIDQMGKNFERRWAAGANPIHQFLKNPLSAVTGTSMVTVAPFMAMEANAAKSTATAEAKAAATAEQQAVKAENTATQQAQNIQTGTIYEVPANATKSGKPNVGRHNQPNPAKTRKSNDGRDRTKAKVIDTYDKDKVMEGRQKEQKAIDDRGGVDNLDNKRNEIKKVKS